MYLRQRVRQRARGGQRWTPLVLLLVMGAFTLLMVSPVLWLLSASLQNDAQIFAAPFSWLPAHPFWDNYIHAWENANLGSAFLTSMEVTLLYVPVHVFLCTLTGYVFAKFQFRGKNAIFFMILMTLLIPQEVTFFSVYGMVKDIGWLNTPQGVVLPFFYSGFGIFLMRQFALSVPTELIEAARIDGCSETRCFLTVVLPLLEAGMVALAILALTFIWGEFTWSRLVLSDPNAQTLPIVLYFMTNAADTNRGINYSDLMAASVISAIPVILLFLFFQRRFIESVSRVGLRG